MPVLPSEIHDLITTAFDSVESVEIFMLLRRSPQTYWGKPAIAEQLGIRPEIARAKLDALRRSGIVTVGANTGAFRYLPADDDLRRRLDELADAYTNRRISVINTIYAANLERLRAFSNAFRVK